MGTWLDTSLMRSVTWAPDSTTPCVDSPQCSRSRSVLVHLDYTGGTLTTHENWEEGAGSIGQGWFCLFPDISNLGHQCIGIQVTRQF